MKPATKTKIIESTKKLFSARGYEGTSIRNISKESGIGISSIYHFFNDKDTILKELFEEISLDLGRKRRQLKGRSSASEMLKDRIKFQFENSADIIFVLKYYVHFKSAFKKNEYGYYPEKGYQHIHEVLVKGVETGEFTIKPEQTVAQAKVITHAINGFLLEYYPDAPKGAQLDVIIQSLYSFILKGLTKKEEFLWGSVYK